LALAGLADLRAAIGDVLNRRVKLSAREVVLVRAVARLGSHRKAGGKAILAVVSCALLEGQNTAGS
jgi:hypothetical protein